MGRLLLVSFIWAFSFGLIGSKLAGVDSTAVATLRLALALVVFLPFLKLRHLKPGERLRLLAVGAVQFGAMYVLYQRSYFYLPSYAVVLFTLPMPLYVAACAALVERQLRWRYALAALLAIAGAAAVVFTRGLTGSFLRGFLLVQASNICFAAGQIAWRRVRAQLAPGITDTEVFALPYAGAVVVAAVASGFFTDWSQLHLTATHGYVLLYLGVISSGACFFWWNQGATRVNPGTLAVFNNAKVPLAVACSLLFFGEHADLARLLVSGVLMGVAVWVAEKR